MFRPADSGEQPVLPGNPEQSELLRRMVTEDEDERMPPADFGQRLLPEEVQAIREWIAQGAQLPQHWSFIPPSAQSLPAGHHQSKFFRLREFPTSLAPSPTRSFCVGPTA